MSNQPDDGVPDRVWIDDKGRVYPMNLDNADFDSAPVCFTRTSLADQRVEDMKAAMIQAVKQRRDRYMELGGRLAGQNDFSAKALAAEDLIAVLEAVEISK